MPCRVFLFLDVAGCKPATNTDSSRATVDAINIIRQKVKIVKRATMTAMNGDVINALLQIPLVLALIFLVLKLEDKRQKSAELREQATQKIIDSLLGVIDELASRNSPNRINSQQLSMIQDYLRDEQRHGSGD